MNTEQIEILFKKYITGELSAAEEAMLFDALQDLPDELILGWMDRYVNKSLDVPFPQTELYHKIRKQTDFPERQIKKPRSRRVLAYAATLIVFIAAGYYAWQLIPAAKPLLTAASEKTDDDAHYEIVLPSASSAKLSFSDGQELLIADSIASTIHMNGLAITNVGNDLVELDWTESSLSNQSYSFTTPKGSSYQVKLQDGTLVWLNSASTLRIEPGFNSKGRQVTLEGEAYFRVARNLKLPFSVSAQGAVVKVLGTHFNVKAYPKEKIVQTALEEGSVEMKFDEKYAKLIPGQQASYSLEGGKGIEVKAVDLSSVLSWKEGYFRFDDQGIEEILNALKNWYTINDIVYRYLPKEKFTGSIARTSKLSDVLRGLEVISDIKFRIEERRVIVAR